MTFRQSIKFENLRQFVLSVNLWHWAILAIIPLICIVVFMLPAHIQSTLSLRVEDTQWWQPFTFSFVHADFEHIEGNLITYMILTVGLLLLVSHLRIQRPFAITLGVAYLLFILTATLWTMLYYPRFEPAIGASVGLSGFNAVLLGMWFCIGLRVCTRSQDQFSRWDFYAILLIPLLSLAWMYAISKLFVVPIILAVGFFMYFGRAIWIGRVQNLKLVAHENYYVAFVALMGIFMMFYPSLFFPKVVQDGNTTTVAVALHYFGLVIGVVAGYVMCRKHDP